MRAVLIVFLGFAGLHLVEDAIWITLARYTAIPTWGLFIGVGIVASASTWWSRKRK